MRVQSVNEKEKMTGDLRALDFVIQETALYLDGHPGDGEALAYYKDRAAARNALARAYEERFGPLTIFGGESGRTNVWQWVSTPWPWEN